MPGPSKTPLASPPPPLPPPQHGSSRDKEEEYAVFMHPIPHNFRWQEIKDIARTYCAAPVRQADTVEPSHDLGYVLIAGLRSALKAYQGFCENGIAGRKVRVSLNGPYSSRKNFTNAINHGQADKLICNNLAEYDQHQLQIQAVDHLTRSSNRPSGPSLSAVLGSYNCNNTNSYGQHVPYAYPTTIYSTTPPPQFIHPQPQLQPGVYSRGVVNCQNNHNSTGGSSISSSSDSSKSKAINHSSKNNHQKTALAIRGTQSEASRRANQLQSGNIHLSHSEGNPEKIAPRGIRIINLPGDVSGDELNKFLKRKTGGGSVEPGATRISRSNGKYAIAQTVFRKASSAIMAVEEIKAFGKRPVRVEFDQDYELRTRSLSTRGSKVEQADDNSDEETDGQETEEEKDETEVVDSGNPSTLRTSTSLSHDHGAHTDGPVVVDGARGSRHKRPPTDSEGEKDDDSSSA